MAVQERLSLDALSEHTLILCEHLHRYQLAAQICRDLRVLDLACGIGYGTEVLAGAAGSVHGVDIDAATVDLAAATVGKRTNATFSVGDAAEVLAQDLAQSYDAIVCFEGLEHLNDLDRALDGLRRQALHGIQLVLSIPNSRTFGEENEFHVTSFGYNEMRELVSDLPHATVLSQYLAEGSVIVGDRDGDCEAVLEYVNRAEPEYANHFLILVNVPEPLQAAYQSQIHVAHAPVHNRYMRSLEHAYRELRRRNSELTRKMLRRGRVSDAHAGAGAVGVIAGLEARILELETEIVKQDDTIFALRRELRQIRRDR